MSEEKFLGSITIRINIEVIKFLSSVSGRGKNFRDRSEALRHYLDLGRKVEAIMELRKDPEKQNEFNEKFKHLMGEKNLEQIAETMTQNEIESAIFFLENMKTKKAQEILDKVLKS